MASRHGQERFERDPHGPDYTESERELYRTAKESERFAAVVRNVSPYGPGSPWSFFRDCAAAQLVSAPEARERLEHFRGTPDAEKFAVGSSTLGGIVPVMPLWVAEALEQAVRSAAPLYAALLKLPLPPQGVEVEFSRFSAGAVADVQAAEGNGLSGSSPAIGFVAEPFSTIGTYVDYSFQVSDRSGGVADTQIANDLGAAWAAKIESELWVGSGSGGHIRGLTAATPTTTVAAAGQTAANNLGAVWNAYQCATMALGRKPDLLAVHPRRSAFWMQSVAAAGPQWVPDGVELIESPAAPGNLGAGTNEDWVFFLNRQSVPLATDGPKVEFQTHSQGSTITTRAVIHGYAAFATAVRPEGLAAVTGLTTPTFS